ncbi:MAG TPA: tyramine oxidase, partial [Actinomycetes bacterium]|nr:tyramine oxidase [Actinomycetes bacterium]
MTVSSAGNAGTTTSAGIHPLQRLSVEEIRAARTLFEGKGLLTPTTRFALLGLEEPPKDVVLSFVPGDAVDRRVRAVLLDTANGQAQAIVASLSRGEFDSIVDINPAVDGQPPILLDELVTVDEIAKADPGWCAAMARRGITDLSLVRPCPLSAGNFGIDGEEGRRVV